MCVHIYKYTRLFWYNYNGILATNSNGIARWYGTMVPYSCNNGYWMYQAISPHDPHGSLTSDEIIRSGYRIAS